MRRTLLSVLLLSACSSSSVVALGTPFHIGVGESKQVDGVTVEVINITDSRCPPTTNCVWEGDAAVELRVNGESASVHSHGGSQYPRAVTVAGYNVTLRDVTRDKPQLAVLIVERGDR